MCLNRSSTAVSFKQLDIGIRGYVMVYHYSVRPSEIKYFKIGVHHPYRVDLIVLIPRMSSLLKLEDV